MRCKKCTAWMVEEIATGGNVTFTYMRCTDCGSTCNPDGTDFVEGSIKLEELYDIHK